MHRHARHRQLCRCESSGCADRVPRLARHLDEPSHRVAHESEQVGQSNRCRIAALLRRPAEHLYKSARSHRRSRSDLGLAPCLCSGYRPVPRQQVSYRARVYESFSQSVDAYIAVLIHRQEYCRQNTCCSGGRCRNYDAHARIGLRNCERVDDRRVYNLPADLLAVFKPVQLLSLSAEEAAHRWRRIGDCLVDSHIHDTEAPVDLLHYLFSLQFTKLHLSGKHDVRNIHIFIRAELQQLFRSPEIPVHFLTP